MYCPDCGNKNPDTNKFCGMCGERLPERNARARSEAGQSGRADAAEVRQHEILQAQLRAEEQKERVAAHDPEPVVMSGSMSHEPVGAGLRASAEDDLRSREVGAVPHPLNPPRRIEPPFESSYVAAAPVESRSTNVSGPSFLGLGNAPANGSSEFSYLYEDEPPSSHAGLIVFLLVLAVLGGVLYAKWQPIRDYVVSTAIANSQGKAAPVSTSPDAGTASNAATVPPTTDPANNPSGLPQQDNDATGAASNSDVGGPAIETVNPNANTGKSTTDKSGTDKSKTPDETSTPKDEQPEAKAGGSSGKTDKESAKASDKAEAAEEKTPESHPVAARHSEPAAPAGAELVAKGEKYLYGHGAPKNCQQALTYFKAAAKEQNPSAMSQMGALYATGVCVPFDRAQAYQWFSRALHEDRSNTYLEHNLNMLWRDMSADEKARATRRR